MVFVVFICLIKSVYIRVKDAQSFHEVANTGMVIFNLYQVEGSSTDAILQETNLDLVIHGIIAMLCKAGPDVMLLLISCYKLHPVISSLDSNVISATFLLLFNMSY